MEASNTGQLLSVYYLTIIGCTIILISFLAGHACDGAANMTFIAKH